MDQYKKVQELTNKGLEHLIYPNGTKAWYKDGKRHREGGPAIINSKARSIITRRLNGEEVAPNTIDSPVLYTEEEFKNMLYDYYLRYSKRDKVKCIIKLQGGLYLYGATVRYIKRVRFLDKAKVFNSIEEAEIFCAKHQIKDKEIINKED